MFDPAYLMMVGAAVMFAATLSALRPLPDCGELKI